MAKISLIIPCWHSAKHMPHLLEDLQAQTFKDFEAILVNDGDESQADAMEAIAALDNRIRIVRQEKNGGVAVARNAGTNIAQAPWVGYADPDDRFGPHYLQSLYEAVNGTGAEMACGGFTFHYYRTGKEQPNLFGMIENSPQVMDLAEAYEIMHSTFSDGMMWTKLYSLDVMRRNGVHFNEKMLMNEDQAFNYQYYQFIKKIGMVRNCEYKYYIYGSDTMSHSYDPFYMENLLERLTLCERTQQIVGWSEQQIMKERNKTLTYESFRMCSTLYSYRSPLTVCSAARKIREEILAQPDIVSAILQGSYKRDRMIRLHQWMVRKCNANLMALVYKLLYIGKSRFGNLYARINPFFRGEA